MRSSLLSDGLYSLQGQAPLREISRSEFATPELFAARISDLSKIVTIFTIGTVATEAKRAMNLRPEVAETLSFVETRKPPRFPGAVQWDLAARGQTLYTSKCASCHGTYEGPLGDLTLTRFPNVKVKAADWGTDPARLDRLTAQDLADLQTFEVARGLTFQPHQGYMAPILDGLWAEAPYLHNGSVPTLWDLMHPATRPATFTVGGHALDYQKVGISYPPGYTPFSEPAVYLTTDAGHSNRGHERPFDTMTEDEKTALLEYLKLL